MELVKKNLVIERVRFEGVSFGHEGQDAVLTNCDFEFPANKISLVQSPEGSGKSTLMQLMAGLLIPQSGAYILNDEDASAMTFEEFLPYRLQIGFSFDYGGLLSNRTIFDNLLLPLVYHKILSEGEARKRVEMFIERFELKKFRSERPANVPGRIRKLTVLLRALITHPQLVLLDDPSVGIGEGTQMEFVDMIKELRAEGFARHVIITSYDEKFMRLIPHDIIHLDGGLLYHQPSKSQDRAAL